MHQNETFVLLLRGINVGGKHRLTMADLRSLLDDAGCEKVETYIQSGNVVFDWDRPAQDPSKAIGEVLGTLSFSVPFVLLRAERFASLLAACPFAAVDAVHVFFADDAIAEDATNGIASKLGSSEQMAVSEQVIYLAAPDGVGRSKAVQALGRLQEPILTARNWKTCQKLLALANLKSDQSD